MTPSPYRAIIESMFSIVENTPERRTIPFLLSETQAHLDANWTRNNLITKVRQHAQISTYITGRFVAKCLSEENRNCVIVSDEAGGTARLLERARFIINNLRNISRPPRLSTDRTEAIVFSETNSRIWIGTAGQRTFGHGDTISDLHLSEAAFYNEPERLVSGVFPAAEQGEITIESTGNGRGNWFHKMAQNARNGLGFTLFFYPWVGLKSCSLPLTPELEHSFVASLREEWEEPELFSLGISLSQLAWRRERIVKEYGGDVIRFKENYPRHFEECFRAAGLSFFPQVNFKETPRWKQRSRFFWFLEGHPKENRRYVAGSDVGGGVGQDNSVLEIFDLDAKEQVGEWASPTHAPDEAGREIAALCQEFNNAYLNVERNNHGLTTISVLASIYPLDRLHRGSHMAGAPTQVALQGINNYGTLISDATTRGLLIGTGRELLRTWTIHSQQLNDELSTFVENKSGKFEAATGSNDDRVFAACHALFVVERASIVTAWKPRVVSPTSGDFVFDAEGNASIPFERVFPNVDNPPSRYGISEKYA